MYAENSKKVGEKFTVRVDTNGDLYDCGETFQCIAVNEDTGETIYFEPNLPKSMNVYYKREAAEWEKYANAGLPRGIGTAMAHFNGKLYIYGGSYVDATTGFWVTTNSFCSIDTVTRVITPLSPGPSARYGHSMVAHRNFIYLFGGGYQNEETGTSDYYIDFWRYNCLNGVWESLPDLGSFEPFGSLFHPVSAVDGTPLPKGVIFHQSVMQGDSLYILGGTIPTWITPGLSGASGPEFAPHYKYVSSNIIARYDLKQRVWSSKTEYSDSVPLANVPINISHHTVVSSYDKIYLLMGINVENRSANRTLWAYNVVNNTWAAESSMPGSIQSRYYQAGGMLCDKIYVWGGKIPSSLSMSNYLDMTNDLVTYDIKTQVWTQVDGDIVKNIPTERGLHSCVMVNNKLFVASGARQWENNHCELIWDFFEDAYCHYARRDFLELETGELFTIPEGTLLIHKQTGERYHVYDADVKELSTIYGTNFRWYFDLNETLRSNVNIGDEFLFYDESYFREVIDLVPDVTDRVYNWNQDIPKNSYTISVSKNTLFNIGDVFIDTLGSIYQVFEKLELPDSTVLIIRGMTKTILPTKSVLTRVGNTGIYHLKIQIDNPGNYSILIKNPDRGVDHLAFSVRIVDFNYEDVVSKIHTLKMSMLNVLAQQIKAFV